MGTSIIGPIQLTEHKPTTELTSPQIHSFVSFDSRITQRLFPLSLAKIRELRKDPTIQLARLAVLAPMVHTPWVYEASKIGKHLATKEMIDTIEDSFSPLRDWFLTQAVFGTLDFGWQPFEVIYTPTDEQLVKIEALKALLQDFTQILIYLNTGGFAGFANETWQIRGSTIILEAYALNTNFSVEGTDWYGMSVFENLKPTIDSWNTVEKTASRYDKKIAGATWIIYYPVGSTPYNGTLTKNDEIAADLLRKLEASGAIAIPDEVQAWVDDSVTEQIKGKWRVELITADSSTQSSFIDRQKYLDSLKMRAFGLPERSVLEGKHGTKEEADVHGDVALATVDSRHRLICDRLNTGPVKNLMRINYGKKYENAVKIVPAPLVDNQFATIKEFYRLILQAPEVLEHELQNINVKEMRDKLGVPSVSGAADAKIIPRIEGGEE